VKKRFKRVQKTQTTEYFISNSINELNEEKSFFNYYNFLYLEFKGNKLLYLSKIKEYDVLSFKLSKDIFNDIISVPKDKISIKFNNNIFKIFQ